MRSAREVLSFKFPSVGAAGSWWSTLVLIRQRNLIFTHSLAPHPHASSAGHSRSEQAGARCSACECAAGWSTVGGDRAAVERWRERKSTPPQSQQSTRERSLRGQCARDAGMRMCAHHLLKENAQQPGLLNPLRGPEVASRGAQLCRCPLVHCFRRCAAHA